ncbi:MAG TPA: hypothetical protein PKV41_06250 [Candidatus Omnitrophota bacterium]|nr:hypothetical protein [Candidatus Omnitrophota bacterium]
MFSVIQEDELITLIVACFVFLFILLKREDLKGIPYGGILILSYILLFLGWTVTVLEGFFLEKAMNALEHFFYMANIGVLMFWCYKFFYSHRQKE